MKKSWIIRKDEKAVSPVIATILMVAITVVLAAVLYVMVTGLLAGPGPTRPAVTFSSATPITNGFQANVAGASQAKPAANYKVNLQVNATAGTAVVLAASMTFAVGGSTYTVTWTDPGGEGDLTGGDQFRVTRTTPAAPLLANTEYTLYLLWSDGSQIQTAVHAT